MNIFKKNSFRNDLHTPLLPYLDTQRLKCKNSKYLKMSTMVCKKIFLMQANKLFCTGCLKIAFEDEGMKR